MGKRTHGVVAVQRVPHAEGDTGAGLFVSGVGVPHGDHDASIAGCFYGRRGTEHLRRDGENAGVAGRGSQKSLQQIGGWQLDPFGGMHAAAHLVDEWAFVVDAKDFRSRLKGPELLGDVARNSSTLRQMSSGPAGYGAAPKRDRALAPNVFSPVGTGLLV